MSTRLLLLHSMMILSLSSGRIDLTPEAAEYQGSATAPQTQSAESVRAVYEAKLAVTPGDLQAQWGEVQVSERMALDARAAGNGDLALRTLLRARGFAPSNTRLLYDLGILEDEMHLFLDADKVLTEASALGLNDPNLLYAAGRVKLDLGELDAAEHKLGAYLAERPEDPTAHYAMGRIYRQGARFEQAAAEFERSIALRPLQTEAYYQLGETELSRERYPEALRNFAVTLERNPKHAGALAGTGIAYYKQRKYDLAEAPLQSAVVADPGYQPGHYYLGLVLARIGRKEESSRELAEATRLAATQNRESAGRLRIYSTTDTSEPR